MPDAEVSWYSDGSSFVQDGRRYAGVAVTTEEEVIWAEPMSPGTCAHRAELPALTKALELGQGQKVSVYNNSRYACATALVHGSMYKESGLLTTEGKKFKIKEQILTLLKALWLPKKLATMHCSSHQRGDGPIPRETTWQTNRPTGGSSD